MTSHTSFQLLTMSPEEQWRKYFGWTWYSFLLPLWQSSNGVADGLSWVRFCPCMVYSKMHYCMKTFISRDKDVFWVETSDKNRAKKVFHQSLWKEPRSWDWLPLWNQKWKVVTMGKAGLEAFWPNDKSKWSENNRRGEGGIWKTILSVFLLFSSGKVNSTNFEYSTLHSLDSVDAFDTRKYFTWTLCHNTNLIKMMMKLILKIKSPIVRLLMTREQTWPPSNPFRRTLHFVHWTFSDLFFFLAYFTFCLLSDYFDMLFLCEGNHKNLPTLLCTSMSKKFSSFSSFFILKSLSELAFKGSIVSQH